MTREAERVLVTPTSDLGKILACAHSVEVGGEMNLAAGTQVAQLALKHRQNKKQQQRMIVFVGSPVKYDKKMLELIGRKLKKNVVAIGIVNFGLTKEKFAVTAQGEVIEASGVVVSGKNVNESKYKALDSFSKSVLPDELFECCEAFGKPSPIQPHLWPFLLDDRDSIGIAAKGPVSCISVSDYDLNKIGRGETEARGVELSSEHVTMGMGKPDEISMCQRIMSALIPEDEDKVRGDITKLDENSKVVLDLDETLVCAYETSSLPAMLRSQATDSGIIRFELECISSDKEFEGKPKINYVTVFERPGLKEFLKQLSEYADLIFFTAGLEGYAGPLVDKIDSANLFSCRLYRPSTISTEYREHVKDLSCLSKDFCRIVIVDNNPFSFLLQPLNGIPCIPFSPGQPHDEQAVSKPEPQSFHILPLGY
ncbi:protein-serine/threonine phosphatase [Salvia divinorum]|uniref:Protein-serine/threonine phosphatase n=1 Tax=Salvia divinorum TaxID=28513 RepID=A0ABD1FHP7_SALDI